MEDPEINRQTQFNDGWMKFRITKKGWLSDPGGERHRTMRNGEVLLRRFGWISMRKAIHPTNIKGGETYYFVNDVLQAWKKYNGFTLLRMYLEIKRQFLSSTIRWEERTEDLQIRVDFAMVNTPEDTKRRGLGPLTTWFSPEHSDVNFNVCSELILWFVMASERIEFYFRLSPHIHYSYDSVDVSSSFWLSLQNVISSQRHFLQMVPWSYSTRSISVGLYFKAFSSTLIFLRKQVLA